MSYHIGQQVHYRVRKGNDWTQISGEVLRANHSSLVVKNQNGISERIDKAVVVIQSGG